MSADRRGEGKEPGFALVSVLWGVSILSLIAASMISSSAQSYRAERNMLNQMRAEYLADAGIVRGILDLMDTRPQRQWPADGRRQKFDLSGSELLISIQDVFGLIDINAADRATFTRLFESVGLGRDQAAGFADRIIDWRSGGDRRSPNGATATDYLAAGYTYRPRRAAFQSVEELQLILGMTPEIFARVEPALTIYSRQPAIDPSLAPKEALLALPDMNPDKVNTVVESRSHTGPNAASALTGRVFAIRSEVITANRYTVRRAVIRLVPDPGQLYVVLAWK